MEQPLLVARKELLEASKSFKKAVASYEAAAYFISMSIQLNLFSKTSTENITITNDTKICRICNLKKSTDNFFYDRGKLYSKCKQCFKHYNKQLKEVHKKAPPKPSNCECCGKVPNKWACDHYPNTTKFRGWVCWECNNAAGSVGDSYEGAVKLFNYLYAKK